MKTVQDLRKKNSLIYDEHKEEIKRTIEYWIDKKVIPSHRPWRAVIGNKRCKPIPIHRDFAPMSKKRSIHGDMEDLLYGIMWPDFEESEIREHIESLGFVIGTRSKYLAISVPSTKNGESLTFAQGCAKKVNDNYSRYCQKEKHKAEEIFPQFIEKMYNTPTDNIKIGDNCVIYKGFMFSKRVSQECATFCYRLLKKEGIEPYYEEIEGKKKYKGMAVMNR